MLLVHIDPDWSMDTKISISHMCWRELLTCTSLRGISSTYGTGREVALVAPTVRTTEPAYDDEGQLALEGMMASAYPSLCSTYPQSSTAL